MTRGNLLSNLIVALSILLIISCSSHAKSSENRAWLEPGDHEIKINYAGEKRSYLVHIPKKRSGRKRAVVMMFHGGGGRASHAQNNYEWDELSDKYGFVVVYPNGSGKTKLFQTWNTGKCCGYALQKKKDDLGYVDALYADLKTKIQVDTTRIYGTGHSNGSMMTYYLAQHRPDMFAAVAGVAGIALDTSVRKNHSIPILHIHSKDDPRAIIT
ncbi:MAG: prolyl oligopeptidase family serine peptidase [Candidatus Lindowbacteria bacterium]|nr:prolyl oligopeptidase family serine peptidase [Candidatus Lindowbacteria bacterium]